MFKKQELKKLTTENVRKSLEQNGYNELDLCRYYITDFKKLGKSVNSDLRANDTNASLHVKSVNDRIIISDFGYKIGMTIYMYIHEKYFKANKHGFMEALELIRQDFHLKDLSSYYYARSLSRVKKKPIKHNLKMVDSSPILLQIKPRKWSNEDTEFWNQYHLDKIDFHNSNIVIKPLSKFRIVNELLGTITTIELNNNLSYAYCAYYDGKWHYKIYSPYGVDGKGTIKWVSNVKKDYVFGKTSIKNYDVLIIQSSAKDKVLINKMGYYSLPLSAEGMWFSDTFWNKLRMSFKTILLFANNDWEKEDNSGINLAVKHYKDYKIDGILTTPNIKDVTDISDYTQKYNFKKAKLLVDKLIEKKVKYGSK